MLKYEVNIESMIAAPDIDVEIRNYRWTPADVHMEQMSGYALCLNYFSDLGRSRTCYSTDGSPGSFIDTGALFFVPAGVFLHGQTSAGRTRGTYCSFDRDWF